MTVKWVDWRLYKNQAAADRAAARIANAPDISWMSNTQTYTQQWSAVPAKTTNTTLYKAQSRQEKDLMNRMENVKNDMEQTKKQLNSMASSVAQNNSRNAQVGTGDVAEIQTQPQQELTQAQSTADRLAKTWNGLSYEEQQARLRWTVWLKEALAKKWITSKTAPEETTTPQTTVTSWTTWTTAKTPKQEQWDYQDNSQARMDEIARNLDWFRQTNPELFQDASTFYNFFIDWKWRSQDQIDYLWDYFNRVQKFGKYDNMPSSSLWNGIADWSIPQDYLNYLKSYDPAKYQEVLSYKQDAEDRIRNESYLNDAADLAWFESEESNMNKYQDELEYAKSLWYLVDKNWDLVDDRLYVQPTDEERKDVDRINEINARRMEIKNMQKNLLDDLTEKYPWVPKATLMGIVQDRTNDISREYDDLWVELVQLQGTVDYLQNERKEQMDAWQSTIDNLQKAYWMYYNYSPAWIISRTRAQYEASNITLDQADKWTEIEKQMALQNVLNWYYEKYGSIIQRSEQQVINDVIAYAKKKWIWLAQALQENFVQQLQSKPEFKTLSSWWGLWWTNKWSTITTKDSKWNDITLKINQSTWEILNLDWSSYDWILKTKTTWWASFTPVSYAKLYEVWNSLEEEYPDWSSYKNGRCWELMNLYLERIGSDIRFGDDVSTKTKWITESNPNATPAIWSIVVWDYSSNSNMSKVARDSWHVARVTKTYADWSFDVWEQNGDWKHTVWTRHISNRDYIAWFIDPAHVWTSWWDWWAWSDDYTYEVTALAWIPTQLRNTDVEKQWYLDILWKMKDDWLSAYEAAMSLIWFKITNKSEEAQNVKNKILTAVQSAWTSDMFDSASMQSMAQAINRWDYESALTTMENKVSNYLYWKKLTQYVPTYTKPVMETLNDLSSKQLLWRKSWTLNSLLRWWNLEKKTAAEIIATLWVLSNKLSDLWYTDDAIEKMLPDVKDKKENFIQKLNVIQNDIINSSNTRRSQYSLPNVTADALLWKGSLYSLYEPSSESELLSIVTWKRFGGR